METKQYKNKQTNNNKNNKQKTTKILSELFRNLIEKIIEWGKLGAHNTQIRDRSHDKHIIQANSKYVENIVFQMHYIQVKISKEIRYLSV